MGEKKKEKKDKRRERDRNIKGRRATKIERKGGRE